MNQVATVKDFNLDRWGLLYQEFELRKKRMAEDKKWVEEFQAQMAKLSGDAEEYRLNGALVVTHYRNGNLNLSKLEADHPDVVARFTELTTENKFNRQRFAQEEPELFAAYRAKVWLMKDGVSINPSH